MGSFEALDLITNKKQPRSYNGQADRCARVQIDTRSIQLTLNFIFCYVIWKLYFQSSNNVSYVPHDYNGWTLSFYGLNHKKQNLKQVIIRITFVEKTPNNLVVDEQTLDKHTMDASNTYTHTHRNNQAQRTQQFIEVQQFSYILFGSSLLLALLHQFLFIMLVQISP